MCILETLAENKTSILITEIGAYLHLIGRFSEEFIYAQAEEASSKKPFNYQQVCKDSNFFENTGLDSLLKDDVWGSLINNFRNVDNLGELSSNRIKNFCDFIEKHTWTDHPKGLCKILADAHGIVSGIDKALAGRDGSGKQRKIYTFRATAFGHEEEIAFLGSTSLDRTDREGVKMVRKDLFEKLKEILESIKNSRCITYDNYKKFVELIKEYFSKTIGETRRPINEISLYDYVHAVASLTKSNLAKMIIDGWYDPKGKSKWRILKINIDVIGLLSKGLKIGDVLGYRNEIEETYDEIKKILEFEHPLGNEVYRDSTGIYFSCPSLGDVNRLKLEVIDKLRDLNKLDFDLQIGISNESRSMVILASEREESSRRISYPHVGYIENLDEEFKQSQASGGEDVCPVCRIRLKPESSDRCERCKDRYEKRARKWLNEVENFRETIWVDEVADKNDRVALVVGKFDLRKWLSGEFVDTFASQTFVDWKRGNQKICQKLSISEIDDIERQFEIMFNDPENLNNDQKSLCKTFIKIDNIKNFNDFWMPIAERDATGEALTLTDNSKKAKHLIKLLFRKHPSFSRIYRIWETTNKFINETVYGKVLKRYSWGSGYRTRRIQFKIEPNPNIQEGSSCDAEVEGIRFSPVCINKNNGIFVSTINLEILERFGKSIDEIAVFLDGKEIRMKCEGEKWRKARIIELKLAEDKYQNYLPYVRIYDFPDLFMVLVPAYEALDIAEEIINEYGIQLSKVRERLPFHIGIIAFHRKTPLYVVIDAARRLMEAFEKNTNTIEARVISIKDEKPGMSKELKVEAQPYSSIPFKWKIDYSTGDPEREDLWHPYIRIIGNPNRTLSFDYTGRGDYVIHIKEVQEGDRIKFEPSYFKLFYLESLGDRFKASEYLNPLDDIHRIKGLWKKIEEKLESKIWSLSQIYAFWEDIEKRRDYNYDDFERFMKSDLVNILKISPKKSEANNKLFEEFLQAVKDKLLETTLHWNLQVRKIKLRGK